MEDTPKFLEYCMNSKLVALSHQKVDDGNQIILYIVDNKTELAVYEPCAFEIFYWSVPCKQINTASSWMKFLSNED